MNNRRRLFLSSLISAGIHAYVVITADPWIDPPRLEPSVSESLQVTLTVARAETPEPPAEHPADPEPVAPVEDEKDESEDSPTEAGIVSGNPPVHTANASAATLREQASQAQPNKRAAKLVPNRHTASKKRKVAASKVRKSKKTPKRAAAKPTSRKRKPKRSAQVRPSKRNSTHGKRPARTKTRKPSASKSATSRRRAGTKARKLSPSRSAKAGSRPKATSNRVRKPIPRTNPHPRYPRSARRRSLEGTVVLKVLVNTRGRVGECRVHTSSGHRILDERAVKTVRKWTFKPGTKGTKPSAMWIKIPTRFQLK